MIRYNAKSCSKKIKKFSFPKDNRLLKRAQFLNLKSGLTYKYRSGFFLVICAKNGLEINRLGITVTKKTANAVLRNQIKRLVREYFRLRKDEWERGWDLSFIVQGTISKNSLNLATWSALKNLDKCFLSKLKN